MRKHEFRVKIGKKTHIITIKEDDPENFKRFVRAFVSKGETVQTLVNLIDKHQKGDIESFKDLDRKLDDLRDSLERATTDTFSLVVGYLEPISSLNGDFLSIFKGAIDPSTEQLFDLTKKYIQKVGLSLETAKNSKRE